jgi:glycosyltransferase involved in cell wall biosynthesis
VVETLEVDADRVKVARPATKEVFTSGGSAADLGAPFVLTVATLEPRKNLQSLVEAHRLLGGDLLLAVVGAEGWGEQPFLEDPHTAARVRLRRGSHASTARRRRVPVSLRGFGIPIIEAMACGCPVVSSAHPSLDEASGDAAVRADPERPEAIAAAVEQALAERERLSVAGLEHARSFTWRAVGEIFLRGYEGALR